MNDYLENNADSGSDWMSSGDGGYLGLDDPPMPTEAPAPPSAPAPSANNGDDWMSGGDAWSSEPQAPAPASDDWMSGAEAAPSSGGYFGNAQTQPADAGYFGGDALEAAPMTPAYNGYQGAPAQQMAPAQPSMNELAVQAPYLEEIPRSHVAIGTTSAQNLSELVLDVEVPVEVYFGDARLTVEEFLEMGPGSVVELDHAIDAPIELRVRGQVVAQGQLVTINGNYGMRITGMSGEARR
ncbi:MAG: FliM/FliN family flagellar motor switch protein [Thermoleophilia bacterium]|nr:FliM/FliN family flagellar motor switch protein [Thermoleophilia bacterium]